MRGNGYVPPIDSFRVGQLTPMQVLARRLIHEHDHSRANVTSPSGQDALELGGHTEMLARRDTRQTGNNAHTSEGTLSIDDEGLDCLVIRFIASGKCGGGRGPVDSFLQCRNYLLPPTI